MMKSKRQILLPLLYSLLTLFGQSSLSQENCTHRTLKCQGNFNESRDGKAFSKKIGNLNCAKAKIFNKYWTTGHHASATSIVEVGENLMVEIFGSSSIDREHNTSQSVTFQAQAGVSFEIDNSILKLTCIVE